MHTLAHTLILASGSPRRKDLLEAAGFSPQLLLPKVSEIPRESMTPELQISDISARKLHAALTLAQLPPGKKAVVIAADTEVIFNQRLLGKPQDLEDALSTLQQLSGKTHEVVTAVSLFETSEGLEYSFLVKTFVTFHQIAENELRAYVMTGDPLDKAGSYGIQNVPQHFIKDIQGSLSNVIGLPMDELLKFFAEKKWDFET